MSTQAFHANKTIPLKFLLPLLASIIAVSPLAIDMYLPAMPILVTDFDTTMPTVQNSLSIYLIGFSLGLFFSGPLSDKFARRTMVMVGLSGFTLFSCMLAFTTTIEEFLALRFCQAFISSAATVTVPATIRERYQKDTAKGFSYVSMIMMLAPMVAPAIGSVILLHSWQAIFLSLAGYSFLILLLTWRFLPSEMIEKEVTSLEFLKRYKVVLRHKAARLDLLSSMLVSLAFFAFITAIPFVYMTVYQVSEFTFSLLFGLTVFGLMTAHFTNTRWVTKLGSRRMLSIGLLIGTVCSSGLLLVNAFSLPLVFTVIFLLPLMGSISIMAVNADALVLLEFSKEVGTATAVIGMLRFGIGSFAGPILAYFYDGTSVPFAALMWSSIMLVLLIQLSHLVRKKS